MLNRQFIAQIVHFFMMRQQWQSIFGQVSNIILLCYNKNICMYTGCEFCKEEFS